ncbi:MAG: microviridin/marinostatin family tricyclic proteinase inhibitor [Dinghuibacter sp.]|nr:microviridin/marinostatin family tricyclic proteinase inhibitor [Dinghuibacter sp.]
MNKKMKKQAAKKPFFAQLLTKQEASQVAAGATSILKDVAHTMKYPSDGDETTNVNDAAI